MAVQWSTCHFELYDKLPLSEARAEEDPECLEEVAAAVSALERAQMGYKVIAKGHHDSRSEVTPRLTVKLLQLSSASVSAPQKLFLDSRSEVCHW